MLTDTASLPGLYWQDVFPPRPVLPLTGVPAFLGIGSSPDGKQAQVLHLWTQFRGIEAAGSFMSDAVRGFFENGGRDCIVVWLKDASKEALDNGLMADSVIDTADLICAPGMTDVDRQAQILKYCADMGDRFAILDAPSISNGEDLRKYGRSLKERPGSDFGALYGPWLQTPYKDPVPPCGHVAGVYASSDRADVPRAPANIALEGVLDVAALTREQQTQLAQLSDSPINGIRSLRGRGVRIWGARTLSADPQWQYVNVRRLAITMRRWINLNLADVAFEPNDFRLWVRIERELNAYLQTLWQRGHLQGATPNEAFRVRCNGETNPPEVRDRGEVVTQIEFAPTIPNEFIQMRLIHGDTGVAIDSS